MSTQAANEDRGATASVMSAIVPRLGSPGGTPYRSCNVSFR
jgi:hypothetical protein